MFIYNYLTFQAWKVRTLEVVLLLVNHNKWANIILFRVSFLQKFTFLAYYALTLGVYLLYNMMYMYSKVFLFSSICCHPSSMFTYIPNSVKLIPLIAHKYVVHIKNLENKLVAQEDMYVHEWVNEWKKGKYGSKGAFNLT